VDPVSPNIFYTDLSTLTIYRLDKTKSSSPQIVVTIPDPTANVGGLSIRKGAVYWSERLGIRSLQGVTTAMIVATREQPHFALTSDTIYWSDGSLLREQPLP
jgi:hypothetical protein